MRVATLGASLDEGGIEGPGKLIVGIIKSHGVFLYEDGIEGPGKLIVGLVRDHGTSLNEGGIEGPATFPSAVPGHRRL
jgi:hypothetical protein